MQSRTSKSHSKLTLHWEEAGEKQKNNCKRCGGTGLIQTWYDCTETHKVTSECPVCPPSFDLHSLRLAGL